MKWNEMVRHGATTTIYLSTKGATQCPLLCVRCAVPGDYLFVDDFTCFLASTCFLLPTSYASRMNRLTSRVRSALWWILKWWTKNRSARLSILWKHELSLYGFVRTKCTSMKSSPILLIEQKRIFVRRATLVFTGCRSKVPTLRYSERKRLNKTIPFTLLPSRKSSRVKLPQEWDWFLLKNLCSHFGQVHIKW